MFQKILTKKTFNHNLYCCLLLRSRNAIGPYFSLIIPTIAKHLDIDNTDGQLQKKVIDTLCKVTMNTTLNTFLDKDIEILMMKLYYPLIKWRIGREAAVLRKLALDGILILFQKGFVADDLLERYYTDLMKTIISCTDDDWDDSIRNYSIQIITYLIQNYKTKMTQIEINERTKENKLTKDKPLNKRDTVYHKIRQIPCTTENENLTEGEHLNVTPSKKNEDNTPKTTLETSNREKSTATLETSNRENQRLTSRC
eukprot:UN02103